MSFENNFVLIYVWTTFRRAAATRKDCSPSRCCLESVKYSDRPSPCHESSTANPPAKTVPYGHRPRALSISTFLLLLMCVVAGQSPFVWCVSLPHRTVHVFGLVRTGRTLSCAALLCAVCSVPGLVSTRN